MIQPIFDCVNKSPETQIILLRNLSTFAKFARAEEIPTQLLPVLENALTSHNPDILVSHVYMPAGRQKDKHIDRQADRKKGKQTNKVIN